jgi:glycerophosphoryl diester phosphodiesterase
VLIIAHRGDSGEFPENTLPAFASAVQLKADLVELDYHHTADGVPLVIHDKELDRTTNATALWGGKKLLVKDFPVEKLAVLDAGAWKSPRFAGTRLPTLEQSLDVIQAGSVTLVEHKAGDAKTCLDLLARKKLLRSVVVQSFDWQFVADCRRLQPAVVLAALGGKELTDAKLDAIAKTGASIVGWDHKEIDAAAIQRIHARGWKAWVYTVDDPARARELIAAKVDGIITNVPAKMLPLVRK